MYCLKNVPKTESHICIIQAHSLRDLSIFQVVSHAPRSQPQHHPACELSRAGPRMGHAPWRVGSHGWPAMRPPRDAKLECFRLTKAALGPGVLATRALQHSTTRAAKVCVIAALEAIRVSCPPSRHHATFTKGWNEIRLYKTDRVKEARV
jgi:hypothetical protein